MKCLLSDPFFVLHTGANKKVLSNVILLNAVAFTPLFSYVSRNTKFLFLITDSFIWNMHKFICYVQHSLSSYNLGRHHLLLNNGINI